MNNKWQGNNFLSPHQSCFFLFFFLSFSFLFVLPLPLLVSLFFYFFWYVCFTFFFLFIPLVWLLEFLIFISHDLVCKTCEILISHHLVYKNLCLVSVIYKDILWPFMLQVIKNFPNIIVKINTYMCDESC